MSARGRGRPTTGTTVQVRIPPEQLAVLDRMAANLGRTRADLIRTIIRQSFQIADGASATTDDGTES